MITPYKRPPNRRELGQVIHSGRVRLEDGSTVRADRAPVNLTAYIDHEHAVALAHRGVGALVYWNDQPIRWELGNGLGAHVLGGFPGDGDDVLDGLVRLHDFLATRNASGGSLASCSWSLLRATIERPLYVYAGDDRPKIAEVIGGRQLSARPPGHLGAFVHVDLSAAYAKTLGELYYGGLWSAFRTDRYPEDPRLPYFARARVWVPARITYGPLPRRRRAPDDGMLRVLADREYPTGTHVTGLWSRPELEAAEGAGAVVKIHRAWVGHGLVYQPFRPWLREIMWARELEGWAGVFAKTMGNTLWGRFCARGTRHRIAWDAENNIVRRERLPRIEDPSKPVDAAELVTSAVRARLYRELMVPYAERLIGVHTDGGLLTLPERLTLADAFHEADGWRVKEHGDDLAWLGPQAWAYTDGDGERVYHLAGIAPRFQRRAFAEMMREAIGVGHRKRWTEVGA